MTHYEYESIGGLSFIGSSVIVRPIAIANGPYEISFLEQTTTLDATGSYSPDGSDIIRYKWYIVDETTEDHVILDTTEITDETQLDFNHILEHITEEKGSFGLILFVQNESGIWSHPDFEEGSDDITIIDLVNIPPVASNADATPDELYFSEETTLSGDGDDVDGDVVASEWFVGWVDSTRQIFPDGENKVSYSDIKSITQENGTFDLVFRVQDDDGDWSNVDITEITLYNTKPIADVGGPYSVPYSQSVILNGTGSYDPDGTIEEYLWKIDGIVIPNTDTAEPTITYEDFIALTGVKGIYDLTLEVRDNDDEWSDPSQTTINLQNARPIANPSGPYELYEHGIVALDGSLSYDPDGDIVLWKWYVMEEDEENLIATSTTPIANVGFHVVANIVGEIGYCDSGTFDLILVVQDNDDDWSDPSQTTITLFPPQLEHNLRWYKCMQVVENAIGDGGIALTHNFKKAGDVIEEGMIFSQFPNWKENVNNWIKVSDAVCDRLGVHLSQTTNVVSTFGNYVGNEKWFGGVAGHNGKIYCIPRNSNEILVIDPSEDSTYTFGNIADQFGGGVLAPNKKIYCPPLNGNYILKIDPEEDDVDQIPGLTDTNYFGGVLANNGKIYFIPHNAESLLILDPENESITEIYHGIFADVSWSGGVLAPDGSIYCIPATATRVLRINPDDNSFTLVGTTYGSEFKWFSGVLATNGMIYGMPYESNEILKIDPYTGTSSAFGDYEDKWAGGRMASNGLIYGIPFDASSILVIDSRYDIVKELGDIEDQWLGGVLGINGIIYGVPHDSENILRIDSEYIGIELDFVLSRYWNKF